MSYSANESVLTNIYYKQQTKELNMTEIEKLKKEIEDLKLIIESKNNQVESKNKHIKRLERIISNIKRTIPIATEQAECLRTDAIKILALFPLITSSP